MSKQRSDNIYDFVDRIERITPYLITGFIVVGLLAFSAATYLLYHLINFIWGVFFV